MTRINRFKFAAVCIALSCFAIGCNNAATEKTDTAVKPAEAAPAMAMFVLCFAFAILSSATGL